MAKLDVDAVADWHAKFDVSLLNSQVSACARKAGGGGVKAYGIRTEPQLSCVACRPTIVAQWLGKHKRNYVEVEPIVLAGRSVKSTARDACVTGAGFPYERGAHITTQRGLRNRREHLTHGFLIRTNCRRKADHAAGGQRQCPLIKLH